MSRGYDDVAVCKPCLEELVRLTAELSTTDEDLRARLRFEGCSMIEQTFGPGVVPARVATLFSRKIREISKNRDPFRSRKDQEISMARSVLALLDLPEELPPLVSLAARGNAMDYFRTDEQTARDLASPPGFSCDDTPAFLDLLPQIIDKEKKLFYLLDNAAELLFDLPLARALHNRGVRVVLVVKSHGIQNDCTMEDLGRILQEPLPFQVMENGTDAVGTDPLEVSPSFWSALMDAGLILAKGMANYETLRDIPTPDILFCMMAKCRVNARLLSVPQNTLVAKLRLG